jgi:hypothetical protein
MQASITGRREPCGPLRQKGFLPELVPAPTDAEVEKLLADYLDEKYR